MRNPWPKIRFKDKRVLFVAVPVLLLLLVVFTYLFLFRKKAGESYRTAPVKRTDILANISASGTLEPEQVIDVGAQVAGRIVRFGADSKGKTIDYGSPVERGTVLAYIDDSVYAADVDQIEAQLQQAKGGVDLARANLAQAQAKLVQTEREWKRAKELGPGDALSQSDYDLIEANYETAKAAVDVAKASIVQAKNAVAQTQAALRRSRQNLGYCIIRSPIRGVIIDRRVNIGQTVVASLNAPSLFLIAQDLRRMQIWVPVNEADIGSIHAGQPIHYSVDAHPGQRFDGVVGKIRLNATMTQNVVTYTVVVNTDNSNGLLLPYLTANVQFHVDERRGVLAIPNAALRWSPRGSSAESERGAEKDQKSGTPGEREGFVWTLSSGRPARVRVTVGLSDGTMTEVSGEAIKEGMEIIVGTQTEAPASTSEKSPFTPQMPGRNPQKGPQAR